MSDSRQPEIRPVLRGALVGRVRTAEDDPWLSARERAHLNFFETPQGRKLFLGARGAFQLMELMDLRWRVVLWEQVLEHRWKRPHEPLDARFGGWVPMKSSAVIPVPSDAARDLGLRLEAKSAGDLETADLIRSVVVGGQVEIRDFRDGTGFVYAGSLL